MKYKIIQLSALASLGLVASLGVNPAFAEDVIVIENNGSSSQNEVSVTQETKTEVKQENNVQITNDVSAEANTGNNEANNNTGDTAIQTGDASVQVNVNNSGNVSVADTSCDCPPGHQGTVSVSGNGSGSQNTVGVNNSIVNNVNVTNTANVTNNIQGKAVTGKNEANGNNGDVVIKTGSIYAKETIKNGLFNYSYVSAGIGKKSYVIKVDGNGAGSENEIFLTDFYENDVKVDNEFNVFNESTWDLITGENSANKNLGDVYIKTGDVKYDSQITNEGNVSVVEIKCCEEKPEKPENPPTPPSGNGGPGGNGGNGGGGNGGHGGANGGIGGPGVDMLPKTGGFLLYFVLMNAIFLLFGAFMRLRAGRSPSFAFAI